MTETAYEHPLMTAYWKQLNSGFPKVREVFEDCMAEALAVLSREGVSAYLDAAGFLGRMGHGPEPILVFLEEWPSVARELGEEALPPVMETVHLMQRSPNGKAIVLFLQTLAPVARQLHSEEQLRHYLDIALDLMRRTTGSIHGHHTTFAAGSPPWGSRNSRKLAA